MKLEKGFLIVIFLLFSLTQIKGQQRPLSLGFWKFDKIGGHLNLDSYYNYQEWGTRNFNEVNKISYLSPGLKLITKSYIWHPNFMYFDISAEYNPQFRRNVALVYPDQIEDIRKTTLGINLTMFKNKEILLMGFFNIYDGFYNVEDISSIKSSSKNWGVTLGSKSPKLPAKLTFTNYENQNNLIISDRQYRSKRRSIIANVKKSFLKNDRHQLNYGYTDSENQYSFTDNTKMIQNSIGLSNSIFLDKKNNYQFSSNINYTDQRGSIVLNNTVVNEQFSLKLPYNFRFTSRYSFVNTVRPGLYSKTNSIGADLTHKLFSSLNSIFSIINITTNNISFNENLLRYGSNLRYTKKIPKGRFSMNYNFKREERKHTNKQKNVSYINEQHVISDDNIILLENPFVIIESVVVKSLDGTFIYQENFDYILFEKGDYIEIQRIPGGLINNNSIVLIDYETEPTPGYDNIRNQNRFGARITVFKSLISVYYKYAQSKNQDNNDYRFFAPEEYTLNSVGLNSKTKYYNIDVEYINRIGTTLSYKLLRCNISSRIQIKKFVISANANLNNYFTLNDLKDQFRFSSNAKVLYRLGSNTTLNYSLGYKKTREEYQSLDFLKSKLEYSSKIWAIDYSFGFEYFHRYMLNDEKTLYGIFAKVKRVF